MRKLLSVALKISLVLFITGCSHVNTSIKGNTSQDSQDTSSFNTVAVDLISILGQLPGFDPWSTTVQVTSKGSPFGQALINALTKAGYGVQRVSADQGLNHVAYKETLVLESTGKFNSFEIDIRDVKISRRYDRKDGRWVPTSPILLYGIKPTRIVVFNDLHSHQNKPTQFTTGVVFHDENGVVIESRKSTVNVNGTGLDQNGESLLAEHELLAEKALLLSSATMFTRQRAAADLDPDSYDSIAELIVRFPTTDPNTIGQNNKAAIANLLTRFNAETDHFVIQGCAQVDSLIWDGTESLSLERQQRVNKELLVSGVKANAIRELGCFKDIGIDLPRQSVGVKLNRRVTPL